MRSIKQQISLDIRVQQTPHRRIAYSLGHDPNFEPHHPSFLARLSAPPYSGPTIQDAL